MALILIVYYYYGAFAAQRTQGTTIFLSYHRKMYAFTCPYQGPYTVQMYLSTHFSSCTLYRYIRICVFSHFLLCGKTEKKNNYSSISIHRLVNYVCYKSCFEHYQCKNKFIFICSFFGICLLFAFYLFK